MIVYVVKNKYNKKSNGYMTETGEFINSIWQAELFNDYETAKCYAPALCQVVECELMEITELTDHDKQVRKEVCEEIKKWCEKNFNWVGDGVGYDGQDYNEMIGSNNTINKLRKFLDQIQDKGE